MMDFLTGLTQNRNILCTALIISLVILPVLVWQYNWYTLYQDKDGRLYEEDEIKSYLIPRNTHVKLPQNGNISFKKIEEIYFNYMDQIQMECLHRRRMGSMSDGGWDICLAGPYEPQRNNCLVYSFGIARKWGFDDAMADTFGCDVQSYDPTINLEESWRGKRIHFRPIGLYGEKKTIKLKGKPAPVDTLSNLVKDAGHKGRTIDYLKFDIEGSEWSALPEMISSGQLKYVKQLAFEAHSNGKTVQGHAKHMEIIESLHKLGFKRWHSALNMLQLYKRNNSARHFSCCVEVYYVNINFI